jgi:poly-beta-1,6-N-acetyl-D-glucosamine synthase
VVTAVRDEAESLSRLAACLSAQTAPPIAWSIIDTGSTDATPAVAGALSERHNWITVSKLSGFPDRVRGAAVVAALERGVADVSHLRPDFIAKVDADVSISTTHFERLMSRFRADPHLGIASGRCFERTAQGWNERRTTAFSAHPQCRLYRIECLLAQLPLPRRKGWDGIDEARAAINGWNVSVAGDLCFWHHRPIGARERSTFSGWQSDGRAAWYMGYRPSYVTARALYRGMSDPAALGIVIGYLSSAAARRPRYDDRRVRAFIRRKQSLRQLPLRLRDVRVHHDSHLFQTELLLVSNSGGHLSELVGLEEVWRRCESRLWVVPPDPGADQVPAGERVIAAHEPTSRSLRSLLLNTFLAVRVMRALRPRTMISTGAGAAVGFAWVARLFGVRVIHIECAGRIGVSLSGRLIEPVAHEFFVQWPELETVKRRYLGSILLSEI